MQNDLYTAIAEYQGGTYMKQFRARSPELIFKSWIEALTQEDLQVLNLDLRKLTDIAIEASPVEIEHCEQVWCLSRVIKEHLLLIHFVRTAQ